MINIYLLRHGKTQGKPALNGRTDVLVAVHHQDQICDKLMASGYSFQHLISSPLKRCSDLARRLVANHAVRQCDFELGFQEMDFGCFDGVPFDELQAQWPILETFWADPATHQLPQAESLADFHQRVTNAWERRLKLLSNDTLIIAHGGTIRMILAHVLGSDWQNPAWYSTLQIGNQSVTHIQVLKKEAIHLTVRSIAIPL
ncbi:histidine phosphatase family protein [Vibrio aestuarianus]|uniref:histidine phosphatase family protein n=1 Tax=Vibrio aestuarianus TaxID=28171 RepID=UPI00237CFBB9|nr:histidine phosphatase family protein [Vibrio aestuarianus]MDE1209670.1 histidine phosphatase family protein [Vibrio aestuarianus]